tara:strand:+ start:720 stop:1061 length:342 start_codon:yes stop_codon:yes gene_type:complete
MIITCICGKYEFEVNKKELPKEGRNVQCGVCNEKWFQTPFEKKGKISSSNTTHYFAYSFLVLLIAVSFIGVMETFREDLVYHFPKIDQYYKFIENISQNVLDELNYLFRSFRL